MRFFIAKKQGVVIDKLAHAGDSDKTSELILKFKFNHPAIEVTEVDESTFDSTVVPVAKSQTQKDWEAFKATGTTPAQAIQFLAKHLGLE